MDVLLISNMFPSKQHPDYGIFVQHFVKQLSKHPIHFKYRALLSGRGRSKYHKLLRYIGLYCTIIKHYFRRYDVIYVHFPNQVLPLLWLLTKIKSKKIFLNYHGSDAFTKHPIWTRLNRILTPFIAKQTLIVPSEPYRQRLLKYYPIDASRIIVSPSPGIADCFFERNENHRPKIRNTLGLNEQDILIGCVTRIDQDKGWDDFIQAAGLLKVRHPRVHFLLIGSGSQEEQLHTQLPDTIHYQYRCSQTQLAGYFQAIDALVAPTRITYESLHLTTLEAMASGCLVIGSNCAILQQHINPERGWLYAMGDVMALTKQIENFLQTSHTQQQRMRQKTLEYAQGFHTQQVAHNLVLKLMERI